MSKSNSDHEAEVPKPAPPSSKWLVKVFGILTLAIGVLLALGTLLVRAARNQAMQAAAPIDTSKYPPASVPHGRARYMESCTSCHGSNGVGMPRQGPNLRTSPFVANHSVGELASFIRRGRSASDPTSVMQLSMPPFGGNISLSEPHLIDVAAYLRALHAEAHEERRADPQSNSARQ